MRVMIKYQSGYERIFENVISICTQVSNKDGKPHYEIALFNRSSEHIACHDVKSFDIYHAEFEWERYKGNLRCPVCNKIVQMKGKCEQITYCPYCGNRNR